MSKTACAIVCTYSGFILVAAELSKDVLCMGGAYADLGEARQSLGRHVELGAHLRSTGIDLISTSFSEIWIGDERMTLDSLHGSAAQNGGGANTAPAWYGGAPRSRQMPSPSHPADLGV